MNSDQSPCFGASVLLFIDLLRWRDARRGRDSLAALMEAGMLLINGDGRGHGIVPGRTDPLSRSEEHTSELQSLTNIVCRLLLEKKKKGVERDPGSTRNGGRA